MKSFNLTLGQILTSPSQYVIPVFQRYYRWDQPQWDKLWADLTDLQQPGKTGRHFLGFLVLIPESVMPGQIARYHLIDGQQRLTTLSLLLCALRDSAKLAGFDELAQEIALTTLEHQFKKGTDRYRVFPKLRDRDQYIACLKGELPSEGRIASAIRYFQGRLTTIPDAGSEHGLRAFFSLLTQRLEFVYAQLEGENPFNIFKSLNSTGVPLGQSDLIRNFVFMQVPVEDQDEFEEALWKPLERRFMTPRGDMDELSSSSFFRDFLMRHGEYIQPADTFEAFQRHYTATDFEPKQVAAELNQASVWYEILRGQRSDPDPIVEAALKLLRQLDSSTTYSLLLNLYQRNHSGELSGEELAVAIRHLAGFILRRLVCGENSRGYGRMFVQAIATLGERPAENLQRFLEERGFPDTPRFLDAFVRFNLYGSRYRKHVLEAIERSNEHKEPVIITEAQVEHILPQTLSEAWRTSLGTEAERIHTTWLHTPGNLTLTGYNAELHNRPFEEKRRQYKTSNIVITRQLASLQSWAEVEIQERGQAMAKVVASIWPGPATPRAAGMANTDETKTRFEIRRRFWTGFHEHVATSGTDLKLKEPNTTNALRCGMVGTGVALYAYFNLKNKRISAGAQFYGNKAKALFQSLQGKRDELDAEIGAKLVWSVPARDAHYHEILLRNPVNPVDENLWPHYFDWMRRSLETLARVLGPHVVKSRPPKSNIGVGKASGFGPRYAEYWSAFREHLILNQSPVSTQKPQAQHWTVATIGRSGVFLTAVALATKKELRTELVIHGPQAKPNFHLLYDDRDAIEAELGMTLEWRELPERKHSYVVIRQSNTDPTLREQWPEQHTWLRQRLEAFQKAFAPRLKKTEPESPSNQAEP
jgi:hypothetical protein